MVKILVVDDKPDNLVVVKAICRKHMPEIEVIAAGSGREGIDLTKSEQPDTGFTGYHHAWTRWF